MNSRLRTLTLALVAIGVSIASPLARADAALLSKARALIGAEKDLNAIQALKFTGTLEVADSGASEVGKAGIEIIFQRPDRQRITATNDGQIEITALDGYDAWQRVADPRDPARWQLSLLGTDQIKRLRANTFENLSFYRGIETVGGRIEDRGLVTVDGVACRKLAFVHGPDIAFIRSFDVATGRLVLTETDSGTLIREEGELRSGGLRFPKHITTTNTLQDGTIRTIRVAFDTVEVNPTINALIFSVPTLRD